MENFWINYLIICGGVLISIILPVVKQFIIKSKGIERQVAIKPYLMTGLFSLLAGILIFAFVEDITDWKEALIAGYAWDSTLQKLRN